MPRLSDHDYLQNHELLRPDRVSDQTAFVLLTPPEQWDLFSYYLPHEARSHEAFLAYRRSITDTDSSLPQRAGRAFQKLRRIKERLPKYVEYRRAAPKLKKGTPHTVRVFSEVNPDIDPVEMAKILIAIGKERDHERRVS